MIKIGGYIYNPSQPLKREKFGTLFEAKLEKTPDSSLIVNVIPLQALTDDPSLEEKIAREIQILRQLEGDHIVQFVDVKQSEKNIYLFTENCEGEELEKKLERVGSFDEEDACSVLKQIADAFVTINKQGLFKTTEDKMMTMMHRDINPSNILIDKGVYKLANFGFAKVIQDVDKDFETRHTSLGVSLYHAPQVLINEPYGAKSDIWSAGIVFYEMLFGAVPWEGKSSRELYNNIKRERLLLPRLIKSDTKDLILRMLRIKESERPTWEEVYNHPALKNCKI